MGPLICGYFSIVNTTVLHGLRLVESVDVEEPCIQRADYKLYALTPVLFKGQLGLN